jgi:hypothetical protein
MFTADATMMTPNRYDRNAWNNTDRRMRRLRRFVSDTW